MPIDTNKTIYDGTWSRDDIIAISAERRGMPSKTLKNPDGTAQIVETYYSVCVFVGAGPEPVKVLTEISKAKFDKIVKQLGRKPLKELEKMFPGSVASTTGVDPD